VRAFQETLEHPQLIEDFHGRRVNRVAAEIAKKVRMLFQHDDAAPRAREQQARHHPGWSAPNDDQVEF
jgi:phage head maturation protease